MLVWLVVIASLFFNVALPYAQAPEPLSWRALIEKLEKRIERNGWRDISISFQNAPYGNFLEDELLAYTIRADGTVILQMHQEVKVIKVSPNELLWLCKFLLANQIKDFPDHETALNDSGSFALIVRVGADRKGIWLYNRNNDIHRDVVWQYLLRLGQYSLEHAGLRPRSMAILPVCKGVTVCDEIDMNSDGVVEWLRLRIGFYAFKAGQYTVDFAGVKRDVFLPQGSSEKEFFVNTYLLRTAQQGLKDYLYLSINAVPAYPAGPFRLGLGLDTPAYCKDTFCLKPDLVFKGPGRWRFPVSRDQAVIVAISRSAQQSALARFFVSKISDDGALVIGKAEPLDLKKQDASPIGVWGCVSTMFGLADIDGGKAVFEIGWDMPTQDTIERRIVNFREFAVNDQYQGDIESIKSQLEAAENCKQDLEQTDDLEISVIYCCPAA